MTMIKKIGESASAISLIAMFATGAIAYYAGQAVAEHDDSQKAHPDIIRAIDANKAQAELLKQEIKQNQKRNDEAYVRNDKAQERILDALVRVNQKLDNQ